MLPYIIASVLGLVIGSFASALSYRYVTEKSILGRSKCTKCNATLGVVDLIPLISFIIFRGKCRKCGSPISYRYPAQELIMMILFLANYHLNGVSFLAFVIYFMLFSLVVMSITDIISYAVPDQMLILFLICGLLYGFGYGFPIIQLIIMPIMLGFIGFFLKYACLIFFKKEGLGSADIKIFALSGLYLNVENVSAFLLMSGFFGIIMGVTWRMLGKRTKRFPFVPAIAASFIMCILFPQETQIVNWLVESTTRSFVSVGEY